MLLIYSDAIDKLYISFPCEAIKRKKCKLMRFFKVAEKFAFTDPSGGEKMNKILPTRLSHNLIISIFNLHFGAQSSPENDVQCIPIAK